MTLEDSPANRRLQRKQARKFTQDFLIELRKEPLTEASVLNTFSVVVTGLMRTTANAALEVPSGQALYNALYQTTKVLVTEMRAESKWLAEGHPGERPPGDVDGNVITFPAKEASHD